LRAGGQGFFEIQVGDSTIRSGWQSYRAVDVAQFRAALAHHSLAIQNETYAVEGGATLARMTVGSSRR